jgi:hypothetical protein
MSKILKPKIEEVPIAWTKMLFTIKIAYRGYLTNLTFAT